MSHPLGNANVRQAALALDEGGLLAELWTCLEWTPGQPAERVLPGKVVRELRRRSFPAQICGRVRTAARLREAARLLAGRWPGGRWLTRHERGWCSVDRVFQALDAHVARRIDASERSQTQLTGVYAYEDAAGATFRAAERRGWKKFYDLPIGYWRAGQEIYAQEAERTPAWAATLTGRADSAAKLERKDEELHAADAVIVASSFTRETLQAARSFAAPVHVIPYGAPEVAPEGERKAPGGPLRVLFAGSLGQRKGLSYLLEAIAPLGSHVELTLLGSRTVEGCAALDGAVRRHRWIPSLPHAEVLTEMRRHDVLVFPSLFEGFGLVLLEALSQGLPVITTPNTAGPDLIEPGVEGFIVPIRSAAAITATLELLIREPARLAAMQAAARQRAAACTWQGYRQSLGAAVSAILRPLDASPVRV